MKNSQIKTSELFDIYKSFPQEKINIPLTEKLNKKLSNDIQNLSTNFQKRKVHLRYLVRESGTEPLIRILVEGKDKIEVKKEINDLSSDVKAILNV